MNVWEILAVVAAFLAAGFAAWQAAEARVARRESQAAQADSEKARDESRALAKAANDEFKRVADAQEEANRIAKAAIPVPSGHLRVEKGGGDSYLIISDGDLPVRQVLIEKLAGVVHIDDAEPRDLPVGDSLSVMALTRYSGGDLPRVRISWVDEVDGLDVAKSTEMTLR